jgi:hypothetical protein
MPSRALTTWRSSCADALDEIEAAHAAVGGQGPGRRYATQQINQAYAVLLSSQFQRFCRDLHSEIAGFLAARVTDGKIRRILYAELTRGRKLDAGNPNPGNIGSDFERFELDLWPKVQATPRNNVRKKHLETLNAWRNAIAHQDFNPAKLGGRTELRLQDVRVWRTACSGLAVEFDRAAFSHLTTISGSPPWQEKQR